jgi:hypothetical protein
VPAEQEPDQHGVVGSGRSEAAHQTQVVTLRAHDVVEVIAESGHGLIDIRWPDPVPVPGATYR